MQSAFGVDHGEMVSKGYRLVKIPRGVKGPGGRRLTQAQIRTRGQGAPTRSEKLKANLNRAGEAGFSIKGVGRGSGRAAGKVSGAIERHPGLTGAALMGGGGAVGYNYLRNKEPRKKKS